MVLLVIACSYCLWVLLIVPISVSSVFHTVIKHTHHLDQSHIGQTIIYRSFSTLPQILFHVNHEVKHQQKDSRVCGGHIINHANFPLQKYKEILVMMVIRISLDEMYRFH
jgi:hypothetical protein